MAVSRDIRVDLGLMMSDRPVNFSVNVYLEGHVSRTESKTH